MEWLVEYTDLKNLGLVALAGLLGGIIGIEREISDKPAGLRTHILVAAGSALFMIVGNSILSDLQPNDARAINADPIRVIQAIVVGISFLGTGTIIHQRGTYVEGLTTAASIFLTAGIGIAVTIGKISLAIGTTLLAIVVLTLVEKLGRYLNSDA